MLRHILIALALIAGSAHAGQVEDTCSGMSELAEAIGEWRYADVPMRETMEFIDSREEDAVVIEFGKAMVLDIYDLPEHHEEEKQNRAIREYSNQVYLHCYKGMSKTGDDSDA